MVERMVTVALAVTVTGGGQVEVELMELVGVKDGDENEVELREIVGVKDGDEKVVALMEMVGVKDGDEVVVKFMELVGVKLGDEVVVLRFEEMVVDGITEEEVELLEGRQDGSVEFTSTNETSDDVGALGSAPSRLPRPKQLIRPEEGASNTNPTQGLSRFPASHAAAHSSKVAATSKMP